MAVIRVALVDENGKAIEDAGRDITLLHGLLPLQDNEFRYLNLIDPFGDTTFNRLQMTPFLSEWSRLYQPSLTNPEKQLLAKIQVMAERCRAEYHVYLKFYGD
jgi:hypothetical protein